MTQQEFQDFVFGLAAFSAAAGEEQCFAARRTGLELSSDGGQSWQSVYASLGLSDYLETTCVAVSPDFNTDQTIFAGVGGSLLRSRDAGKTWLAVELPTPPPTIVSIIISPTYAKDGLLFAATMQDGVFRSVNRGVNWSAWNFGLLDGNIYCLAISPQFEQDGTLFAGTQSGIFVSTNRGQGWREVAFPMDKAPVLSLALPADFASSGRIYAGTEAGLYLSTDGGQSWNAQSPDILTGTIEQIILDQDGGPDGLVLQDGGVWASGDGGQTWAERRLPVDGVEIAFLAAPAGLAPQAPLWVALLDGRVLRL